MAALQGIKRRIKSVTSTRQITKAMEMVASSKLRRAQTNAAGPTAYVASITRLMQTLSASPQAKRLPYFTSQGSGRNLVILIAGDQGLAGPYNGNLYKAYGTRVTSEDAQEDIITIGRRPSSYYARFSNVTELAAYSADDKSQAEAIAESVTNLVLARFNSGESVSLELIYTLFENTAKQLVQTVQLLPQLAENSSGFDPEYESGYDTTCDVVVRAYIVAQVTRGILSARASEQSARMLAMMNATNNAHDLINDLTLTYNNARQGAITQEIAEITTGAEAQN